MLTEQRTCSNPLCDAELDSNGHMCEFCSDIFCGGCVRKIAGYSICETCMDTDSTTIIEHLGNDITVLERTTKDLKDEVARLKKAMAEAHTELTATNFASDMLANACHVGRATGILGYYI